MNLDPYNVAARRGQEKIDLTKTHYGEEAYNETRSRQLWQVQKGWEEPVRQYGQNGRTDRGRICKDATGTARITNKLNTIIIPKIEFRDASIREAIDFLRQQAAANDPATEGRKGVDIVLRANPTVGGRAEAAPPVVESVAPALPGASPEAAVPVATPPPAAVITPPSISPTDARITITLNEIPLGEALRYIASQAGLKVKVEPYAVSIIPISEQSNDLLTKEYRVPPGFISRIGERRHVRAEPTRNGKWHRCAGRNWQGHAGDHRRPAAREPRGRQRISREPGRAISVPGRARIFFRRAAASSCATPQDNLELVDALVEQANVSGPKQVEIEAKFVEITQNNLKELGFDWLLGQFNIRIHSGVFGSGGTSGTSPAVNPADFPFVDPTTARLDSSRSPAGNRSGNLAISANAIDALLFGTSGASVARTGHFRTRPAFSPIRNFRS